MKILFVCKHNRFRSRVAKAYFDKINQDRSIEARGAGIYEDYDNLDEEEVEGAREMGIDISGKPKGIDKKAVDWADKIIVVADDVKISQVRAGKGKKIVKWGIGDVHDDQKERKKAIKNIVKDIINHVDRLVEELKEEKSIIYPANKKHFKKLVQFAQKIILMCQKNNITPVIYGSFAHFYHTRDKKMKVNDIDLLIPRKDLPKLAKLIEKRGLKMDYLPKWNTLIIEEGKLRVEVDAIGFWYNDLAHDPLFKNPEKIDFYGIRINLMSLKNLERLYLIAYKRTKDNKVKIRKKIRHLEAFLGRKLR